jgi:glycosyltransferase involved in cell wall biosynthesis
MGKSDVRLIVILFSEMYGVRQKYQTMAKPFMENGIIISINDISIVRPRFLRMLLPFLKGFLIPIKCKTVIVRYTFSDPTFLAALMFRRLLKKRTVFEVHSNHVNEFKMRGRIGAIFSKIELVQSLIASIFADSIICVSPSVEDAARKNFPFCRRYKMIENGVIVAYQDGEGAVSLHKSSSADKNVYQILFVAANYSSWHGLEILIESVKLQQALVKSKFIIKVVGKTSPENIKKMEDLGIQYAQQVERNEVLNLIKSCDICVDSLNLGAIGLKNSSSLKSREYIAYGKPILGSALACDEWAEFTFLPISKIIDFGALHSWLIDVKARELEIQQRGRNLYYKKLSWTNVALKYRNEIDAIDAYRVLH